MKKVLANALIFLLLISSMGCASKIDKNKFRGLRDAARAIDTAVEDTTLPFDKFETLLQKLTEERTKTKAVVNTREEQALLNDYEELLSIYEDGATLWEYKIDSSQYGWIPQGRIYVDAKVRPLIEKYHFPTESHVVELTNHHWESISADSIMVIWEKAHEQLKTIKTPFFS